MGINNDYLRFYFNQNLKISNWLNKTGNSKPVKIEYRVGNHICLKNIFFYGKAYDIYFIFICLGERKAQLFIHPGIINRLEK